jgi:hypothetical protein
MHHHHSSIGNSSPLVKELPPAKPFSYSTPNILPPTYSLHTAAPHHLHPPHNRLQIFCYLLMRMLIWAC